MLFINVPLGGAAAMADADTIERPVNGILQRIQMFLHGIVSPPPVPKNDDDPFVFFEEVAWLRESERIRAEALTFWEANSHKKRFGRVADLSLADKITEKHTFVLSEVQLMRLNALAESALGETFMQGQRDKAFGPAAAVSDDWIRTDNSMPVRPVLSFVDPLENLYEQNGDTAVKAAAEGSGRNNDLYKVLIRMPLEKRIRQH